MVIQVLQHHLLSPPLLEGGWDIPRRGPGSPSFAVVSFASYAASVAFPSWEPCTPFCC